MADLVQLRPGGASRAVGGFARTAVPRGTTMRRKPSRAASATRWSRKGTGRMSPESATSPMAMTSEATARSSDAEATARQTARSHAGSESFAPPTVAT